MEVCQRKGDAGASVRKCVKTREMEIRCFGVYRGEESGGAIVRRCVQRTLRRLSDLGIVIKWYFRLTLSEVFGKIAS